MKENRNAILLAILAALCYGISTPVSKLLLGEIPPVLMAALLYLGAGIGMTVVNLARGKRTAEAKITKREWPYVAGMILLDIAAPIFLMIGLTRTSPANASLFNNFEIVATAILAMLLFKEAIGRRMWIAIGLITLSCAILSFEDISSFQFSTGSFFVLLACLCWGLENNCTRMLSLKDPLQIVILKGFGSGTGSLLIAFATKQTAASIGPILIALLLGFVAYGLSIFFYIHAQRHLGAARTSAYYAFAPFIGVGLSLLVFRQGMTPAFWIALAVMLAGSYLAAFERHEHPHIHPAMEHEHRHNHSDGHHNHTHDEPVIGEHSHSHTHEQQEHRHPHTPDLHHVHEHQ